MGRCEDPAAEHGRDRAHGNDERRDEEGDQDGDMNQWLLSKTLTFHATPVATPNEPRGNV
jgi:hypothetical protein